MQNSLVRLCLCALLLATQLTGASAQPGAALPSNSSPAVSPDGRFIAFLSDRPGNPDVFIVPSGGGPERQLTRTPKAEGHPE